MFRSACATCHSLAAFKSGDLKQLGYTLGLPFSVAGSCKLSDYFVLPFLSSAKARRLNGGVAPPDLSLVLKQKSCRQVRRILTGYRRD